MNHEQIVNRHLSINAVYKSYFLIIQAQEIYLHCALIGWGT